MKYVLAILVVVSVVTCTPATPSQAPVPEYQPNRPTPQSYGKNEVSFT